MADPRGRRAGRWRELAACALLAGTVLLGVGLTSWTLDGAALKVVALVVLLVLVGLWSFTLRRTARRGAGRWWCDVLALVVIVAGIAAAVWWWLCG